MDEARARYIEEALPLVGVVARRMAASLPPHFPLDDLIAAGRAGLVDAAARYEPARGVRFTTFAHYRIRGAILDFVRAAARDDVGTRARFNAEAAVDALITERLGAPPQDDSQAAAASALNELLGEMATAFTLAELAAETAPAPPAPDPETAAADAQRGAHVTTALDRLPELERGMLQRVYYQGQSVSEAGEAMGMSRSWSGRVHARALSALREKLGAVAAVL
jgi:RNA polymerase sigma factor for flagellar operon FliA